MKKIALHWQVVIALMLGVVYAVIAIVFSWQKFTQDFIAPFGEIFIRLLKMIAVPLVLFSIISGISSLKNIRQLGRLGIKTLALYLITTTCAISIGLIVVNLVKPGNFPNQESRLEKRIEYELWLKQHPTITKIDALCESCKKENQAVVARVAEKSAVENTDQTLIEKIERAKQVKSASPLQPLVDLIPANIFGALTNSEMLPIIFFAIFFGVALVLLPLPTVEPVEKVVDGLNEIFVKMINIVISAMPVFVFALMAATLVKTAGDNLSKLIEQLVFLLNYGWVVVVGLLLVAFVFYPLLISLFARGVSFKFFLKGMADAQLTAFSTSSSLATLPVTIECVNEKLGVPKSISSFVLPIGATVNMDGTSMYQAVAVVAMAQFHMIDLTFSHQLIILITATLASIGTAAVPSAGLVMMVVVLESVGLNPAWIAIILPIDRILDMFRTVVNVTGDAAVALMVARQEEKG